MVEWCGIISDCPSSWCRRKSLHLRMFPYLEKKLLPCNKSACLGEDQAKISPWAGQLIDPLPAVCVFNTTLQLSTFTAVSHSTSGGSKQDINLSKKQAMHPNSKAEDNNIPPSFSIGFHAQERRRGKKFLYEFHAKTSRALKTNGC